MGSTLSMSEERELAIQLQGLEPASLASIIWDSINSVGVDDKQEKFGIDFSGGKDSQKVTFWDSGDVTEMPRKVFLEIIQMASEKIISEYENNYDLEKSHELQTPVNKLRLAKQYLQREIRLLEGQVNIKEYCENLESGTSAKDELKDENFVEEVRTRRATWVWSNGGHSKSNDGYNPSRRRTSKGLEAVVDRLPELRSRYEATTGRKDVLRRVQKKLLAISNFRNKSGGATSESSLEEIDKDSHSSDEKPILKEYTRRNTVIMRDAKDIKLRRSTTSSSVTSNTGSSSLHLAIEPTD